MNNGNNGKGSQKLEIKIDHVIKNLFYFTISFKRSEFLEDTYLSVVFMALRKETPAKDLALQKQPFPDVYKKCFLKNLLKPTENTCT